MKMSTLATGIGIGAGLTYLLDPSKGRRRRAIARDRIVKGLRELGDAAETTSRDARNRTIGVTAKIRAQDRDEPVTDQVLTQRVRARMGHVISHRHAIQVNAYQGVVTISGPILSSEVDALLETVGETDGVMDVVNQLEPHESAEMISSLQEPSASGGGRFEFQQENWSPAARFAAIAAGGLLTLGRGRRGGVVGTAANVGGVALIARAITNMPVRRLIGIDRTPRVVDIQKTINVDVPLEDVFNAWAEFERYPRFMEHVREVRRKGDGSYHWVVEGPVGIPVEWDAVITSMRPNQEVSWRSVPGTLVQQEGTTRFDRNPDGTTRIYTQMTYNPPAGAVGHLVATIFGTDPKHQMDEDLVRFKSLIERGKTSAHGEDVTREDVYGMPPPTESPGQPWSEPI